MRLAVAIWLTAGCAPVNFTGEGGDDVGDGQITDVAWPTGSRVLLYYGTGGAVPLSTGVAAFTQLETLSEDDWGWQLDHRDYIPDDLGSYRMIGLVATGLSGGTLSPAEISALRNAMGTGTRLVLFADVDDCGSAALDGVLQTLGLSMRLFGDGTDANRTVTASTVADAQPTAGVGSVDFRDPCYVDQADGDWLLKDADRHVIAASERPSPADGETWLPGDVVLIGDYSFLDDSGALSEVDNTVFAHNLASVEP